MAEGSRRQLIYVAESVWGTTPDTPSCKTLRNSGGAGIKIARQTNQSQEYRTDRAVADLRLGNKSPSLDVPFEFSYGSQDDFLEGALFGAFALAYALTAQTVTVVAATKKFSRAAGSFVADGVKVGDKFITTGFEAAGNNGTFIVTVVEALEVTCGAATGLENVTDDAGVAITTTRYVLKQAATSKFFSIEEGFLDLDLQQILTGAMVNSLSLDIKPNAIVTGTIGLLGKAASAFSASSIDESPDAASTTSPFDSYTGSLKEGDVTIAVVTGLTLNMQNGLETMFALFDDDPYRIGVGRANLTGTLSAYFISADLANKFIAETESSLELVLTDLAGNSYNILVPRIKYTGADKSMTENNVAIDLPFQALYSSTQSTALRIDRIPV